ncbi:MAG TPA: GGDEF domain-containing protein [Desulfotomaculum sp.]|nr:GGDEF domain-containing protein [Desulfotomaculum sp.]
MSPETFTPEINPAGTFTQIYSLFHELMTGLSEKEKDVLDRLARLEMEEKRLIDRYRAIKQFSDRLWEVANVCEILFNISDERKICEIVVKFLSRLYPVSRVRFLYANSGRNRMRLVAASPPVAGEEDRCAVYPMDCLALKRCRPLICTSPEKEIFCSELKEVAPTQGYLCLPLMGGGSVFGCINMVIDHREGLNEPALDENALKIIDIFTTYVSLIINNNLLMKTVRREAMTDRLTGLPNRRYVLEVLQTEIFRCERYGNVFSLALLDVDTFKSINDNYGHDEGDRVLMLIADTASRCLRKVDTVARYGGEEFLVILPHTGLQAAVTVIERFRKIFNQQTFSDFLNVKNVTLSAGLAEYPTDSNDGPTLIKIADERLLRAKRAGRNKVVWE